MKTARMADRGPTGPVRPLPSNRSFGLLFGAVFALVAGWPLLFGGEVRAWAAVTSACFFAASLLVPHVLAPLNRAWMKFGEILHRIVSPVVLALLFFAIITPFGIAMRIFGRDPLRLRKHESDSYWIARTPPGPPPDSFDKQF